MRLIVFAVMLALQSAVVQACDEEYSPFQVAEKPLPEKPYAEFDVAEQQSAEGGLWSIYHNDEGKLERIIRTDYGESGRYVLQFAATGPGKYDIRERQFTYAVPISEVGSLIVREEVDYYLFCDGLLEQPALEFRNPEYATKARAAADGIFNAPEIADRLKAAGFTPPLWK